MRLLPVAALLLLAGAVLAPQAAAQPWLAFEDTTGDVVAMEFPQDPVLASGPRADAVDLVHVYYSESGESFSVHFHVKDLAAVTNEAGFASVQYALRFRVPPIDGMEGPVQLMAVFMPGTDHGWRFGFYDSEDQWYVVEGAVDVGAGVITVTAPWARYCFGQASEIEPLAGSAWLHEGPGGDHLMDRVGEGDRGATGAAGILETGDPGCVPPIDGYVVYDVPSSRPSPGLPTGLAAMSVLAWALLRRRVAKKRLHEIEPDGSARMAGNPVLGFLSVQPTGDGPHATVTKMLRLLGILLLVGFVVSLIGSVLTLTMGASYYDGPAAGIAAAGALGAIIIGVLLTGAALFWITFTITAWNNRDPRGSTHALIIAIIATVFGAIGALGLLGAFGATAYPVYMAINVITGLIAVGYLYCGIMILTNRSKATAGTATTMGASS